MDPSAPSLPAVLRLDPESDEVSDPPTPRPEGLSFRTSPDDVTVTSPGPQRDLAPTPRPDGDDLDESASDEEARRPDLTGELRGAGHEEPPPSSPVAHAAAGKADHTGDFEEEVIMSDDVADVIDVDDDAEIAEETPEDTTKPKRTVPPPIPRH